MTMPAGLPVLLASERRFNLNKKVAFLILLSSKKFHLCVPNSENIVVIANFFECYYMRGIVLNVYVY